MTEQLPDPPAPPAAPSTTADPWSIWFSRLIQIVGVAMVIYQQVISKSDVWLLLVATSMMLGGAGLQMLVRWLLTRVTP